MVLSDARVEGRDKECEETATPWNRLNVLSRAESCAGPLHISMRLSMRWA